ncbi:hypothetical protein HOLleu_15238 [Holothuria leucospilota]|uniref:Uncharacterized protein n=1 Tax=Holothuria leucospilota TaxID=206669 RepID=A0A9Q1C8U0_HOLLE|nr:hypothetical protein HOLleu_15238 [Holothuria leucospilota]
MVENIEFRNPPCPFQQKLRNGMRKTSSKEKVIVPADKTKSLYAPSPDDYAKLLKDKITQRYKVAGINKEQNDIASKLEFHDRVSHMGERKAFIIINDHKDNFPNKVPCRLIYPAKSEMGLVNKTILRYERKSEARAATK